MMSMASGKKQLRKNRSRLCGVLGNVHSNTCTTCTYMYCSYSCSAVLMPVVALEAWIDYQAGALRGRASYAIRLFRKTPKSSKLLVLQEDDASIAVPSCTHVAIVSGPTVLVC